MDRFAALATAGQDEQLNAELARYLRFLGSTDAPYVDEDGQRPVVPIPVEPGRSISNRRPIEGHRPRRRLGAPARHARTAQRTVGSGGETTLTAIHRMGPPATGR